MSLRTSPSSPSHRFLICAERVFQRLCDNGWRWHPHSTKNLHQSIPVLSDGSWSSSVKCPGLGASLLGHQSQRCHLQAACHWAVTTSNYKTCAPVSRSSHRGHRAPAFRGVRGDEWIKAGRVPRAGAAHSSLYVSAATIPTPWTVPPAGLL